MPQYTSLCPNVYCFKNCYKKCSSFLNLYGNTFEVSWSILENDRLLIHVITREAALNGIHKVAVETI